ncbi:DUF6538 domain-containing protein [Pseudooceanicola sp.]
MKDGVYYFVRRVPKDLLHHYTSSKISFSLRTAGTRQLEATGTS